MTIQYSGISNPENNIVIATPTLVLYDTTTIKETSFIYGYRNKEDFIEVYEDAAWIDLPDDCYLINGRFFYPAIVKEGANEFKFRAKNFSTEYSSEVTHTITKIHRDLRKYRTKTILRNAEDITQYLISDPALDINRDDGIIQMTFTMMGIDAPLLTDDDTITYTVNDGLVSKEYITPVIKIRRFFGNDGNRYQEITAQSTNDSLPRYSPKYLSLDGSHNGDILNRICVGAGFDADKIFIPQGNKYVGPRTTANAKPFEDIMQKIMFIESWNLFYQDDYIIILPSYANKFVSFTFQDEHIQELSETSDSSFIYNRLRLAYEPLEDDLNINYDSEDNIPDKSEETEQESSFFKSDLFQQERTAFTPDDVLFFGCWGNVGSKTLDNGEATELDWDNIKKARLTIWFNNTSTTGENNTGGSLLKYPRDLDIHADKRMATAYYDLRQNHLLNGVVIFYQWVVIDNDGVYIGDSNTADTITLTGGVTAANFEQILTQFDIKLSEPQLLATIEQSWTPTDGAEEGPNDLEEGVFYARYDENTDGISYEYYLEADVDDAVIQTMVLDIENADQFTGSEVHLINAEIITEDNALLNGSEYLYGIKSHQPNSPVRRADKVAFKFKSKINLGDTIAIKFSIWGRKFINAGTWEDYQNINIDYTAESSVNDRTAKGKEPATINGGAVLSGFVSSSDQAQEKLKRMVTAASQPYVVSEVLLPGTAEMQAGQLLRIFSQQAETSYDTYYYIQNVEPSGEQNRATLILARRVKVNETTVEPYAPDVSFNLSDMIKQIAPELQQFQFGTVQAQKYRGMYRIKLDSGEEVKYVISRVKNVAADDRVAIVQSAAGSYVIIEIIRPSFTNTEFEELLPPDDETGEDWEDQLDDTGPDGTSEQIPTGTRPFANLILISSIKPSLKNGNVIPYQGVSFDVVLSHDMNSSTYPSSGNPRDVKWFKENVSNFFYMKYSGNNKIPISVIKLSNANYRITPRNDLPFGTVVEVGLMPASGRHPNYPTYTGTTVYGQNLQGNASVQNTSEVSFTVQPELSMELIQTMPFFIDVQFNQRMGTSAVDGDNYFIDISGE